MQTTLSSSTSTACEMAQLEQHWSGKEGGKKRERGKSEDGDVRLSRDEKQYTLPELKTSNPLGDIGSTSTTTLHILG